MDGVAVKVKVGEDFVTVVGLRRFAPLVESFTVPPEDEAPLF